LKGFACHRPSQSYIKRFYKVKPTKMSIGVPIKLLHEAQGHVVTLELNNGTVYRGKLSEGKKKFFF